jgi:hypothetical protein
MAKTVADFMTLKQARNFMNPCSQAIRLLKAPSPAPPANSSAQSSPETGMIDVLAMTIPHE